MPVVLNRYYTDFLARCAKL